MEFLSTLPTVPMGYWGWILLFVCAFFIGMGKTGMQGIGTFVVPILAMLFGAKESTGILLPILCMADLIGIIYYRRHVKWKYILKLVPTALIGFFIALWVDHLIPASGFRHLMAMCILSGLAVMVWSERKGKESKLLNKWWFAALFGLLGGFTTMIGNAAGPIMAVYLLSMRLPKNTFVGTSAWFFMIVNYLKIPLQIFVWDNIHWNTFLLDLITLPAIVLGGLCGIALVKKLPEKLFRTIIIYLTVLSTLLMFI